MSAGPLYHVFCDESRTRGHQFMLFGGIIIPDAGLQPFEQAMNTWRIDHRMTAELKWNKVSSGKYSEYLSLVDLFFSGAKRRAFLFKSVVFNTHEIDYKEYHKGDVELGFYKFFYQFLLHKFGSHPKVQNGRLIIHFDQRSTRQPLETLRIILNRGIRKQFRLKHDLVRAVEAVKSHDSNLVQLADVLMGAVGYQWNDMDKRPDARQAKSDLAKHIAFKAGLPSLRAETPRNMDYFDIWRFRFSHKKKERP